jgi:hypothetical protein
MKPKVELAAPLFTMVDMSAPKVCLCLCLCRLLCECSAPCIPYAARAHRPRTGSRNDRCCLPPLPFAGAVAHGVYCVRCVRAADGTCSCFTHFNSNCKCTSTIHLPSVSKRATGAICSVRSALRRCRPALTVHTMPMPPLCRAVLQLLRMRGRVR